MDGEVFVPMSITSKARPRVTKRGGYNEDKTTKGESFVKDAWRLKYPAWEIIDGPISVGIFAYKLAPKSRMKHVGEPWDVAPDIDNVAKLVLDALNGVAWIDDSQVVRLYAEKTAWVADEINEGIFIAIEDLGDGHED